MVVERGTRKLLAKGHGMKGTRYLTFREERSREQEHGGEKYHTRVVTGAGVSLW